MPVNILTLYVGTFARDRMLRRPLSSPAAAGAGAAAVGDVDETLTLSPMLVGGVEDEDCALSCEVSSTVASLLIEAIGDEARVTSAAGKACEAAPILSRVGNILPIYNCRVVVVVVEVRGRREGHTREVRKLLYVRFCGCRSTSN